jgi:acyl-CoA synthetase (AMP-forming)/AMP-acid ligase II
MVAPGAVSDDGWLHTGDRGRLDAGGGLVVEGRLDDVIVTGGENVAAREVEEALLSHSAVVDAAVVGWPDPEWGEAIVAFVVAAGAGEDELREHCRARLPGFKVPKAVRLVGELPRNAAGKVVKAELPD